MTDMNPITPAPECEYQRTQEKGIPWCAWQDCPCDRSEFCGYDPRATPADIQRERVGMIERLEEMED